MKVSMDGHLEDRQLEDGKRIIETIHLILYTGWFHILKEQFASDLANFAIDIFGCLMSGNLSKEEFIDLLYEKEILYSFHEASIDRCNEIADTILLIKPWVEWNKKFTDDPH